MAFGAVAFVAAAGLARSLATPIQQAEPDTARFEVVSIKADEEGTGGAGDAFPKNGRWRWTRAPFWLLVMYAYDTSHRQIDRIPKQLETRGVAFNIDAKVPADVTPEKFRAMLQTMLAERFQFAMHRELREYPTVVVETAKGGHKLKPATGDCLHGQQPVTAGEETYRCGEVRLHYSFRNGLTHVQYVGRSIRMADLVAELSKNQPLLDETGISGLWDLDVGWDFEMSREGDDEGEKAARQFAYQRSMREAFEKQAGLMVDLGKQVKRLLPTIVVDRAELPSAN